MVDGGRRLEIRTSHLAKRDCTPKIGAIGRYGAPDEPPGPIQAGCDVLHGLVSNSEWTGIPLSILMDEAGVKPNGRWLIATGDDGPIQPVVGPVDTYPKSAGRHWPYATTLFDYIRRAMPFRTPKSLSDDEVYAVTAYILHRNELIGRDEVVNADNLAGVEMPNRGNFVDMWGK